MYMFATLQQPASETSIFNNIKKITRKTKAIFIDLSENRKAFKTVVFKLYTSASYNKYEIVTHLLK